MGLQTESNTTITHSSLKEALLEIRNSVEEAKRRNVPEPTTVSLATSDADGIPSVRTVYLSEVTEEGLIFFVNINSGKGRQIQENPNVGLCRFWPELQQQFTVEGEVEILADSIADEQWRHRTRDSQIASWASDQQTTMQASDALGRNRDKIKKTYDFEAIPRPDNWKAILLHPTRLEFWETGWHRMRQRKLYTYDGAIHWNVEVENP